jgi:starch-binding outer membrane protein SusE/F
LLFGCIFFLACEKDEPKLILDLSDSIIPEFISPGNNESHVLTAEAEDEILFVFEWTEARYNIDYAPRVSYLLQVDKSENNWQDSETIRDIVETHDTSFSMTVGEMNELLIRMEAEPNESMEVSFRLLAFLSKTTDHSWLYSDELIMSLTAFEHVLDADKMYVPGNYQGWDPTNESTVVYSFGNDGLYEGYILFKNPGTQYKFTEETNWDNNWGDNDGNGNLTPSGSNIVADEPGLYRINVDMNQLVHTRLPTQWSIIGDAVTDWSTDEYMTIDEDFFNETWKTRLVVTANLNEGAFKFRANNDWDVNLGSDDNGSLDGQLRYGGENIQVESAGEYTIILDLSGPFYTYEIIAH